MSHVSIKSKFKAINLLGSLAVVLVGLGFLAHPLFSDTIYLKALGLGVVCFGGGLWALITNVWVPACRKCNQFLAEYELNFGSDEDRHHLQTALANRNVEYLMWVLDNAPVPPIPRAGQSLYTLNIESCETCKHTSRMRLTQVSMDANGNKQEGAKLITWTEMNSPLLAHVIQRVYARSAASSAMGFGAGYAA